MNLPVKKIRIKSARKAFTLVEVLIATAIFTVATTIGAMVFTDIMRIQRRLSLENALYEDARYMMERISREIRMNTVDYEEYYNKATNGPSSNFGTDYGCYADRFYYPGTGGPNLGGLGALCTNGSDPKINPCCIINKNTLDINTGQNPYAGTTIYTPAPVENMANAYCDVKFGNTSTVPPATTNCTGVDFYKKNHLYLIDPSGQTKTIIATKEVNDPDLNPSSSVAIVKIEGKDTDPIDGIYDDWFSPKNLPTDFYCAANFDCSLSGIGSLEETLFLANDTSGYKGFIPLTPLRTKVVSLRFYVSPVEDPRKAFAETDISKAIQQQPHVTVVLSLQPAQSELLNFAGQVPTITLQTTVTSRVYNEVNSYDGTGRCTKLGYT